MGKKDSGMFLVELMIVVILISVVATAFWNFHSEQLQVDKPPGGVTVPNSVIQAALDEIGSHVRLARPESAHSSSSPLAIIKGSQTDRLLVRHNNVDYEYFVDVANNLVRRRGEDEIIIASNIIDLRVARIGSQTLIITISGNYDSDRNQASKGIISRSYSIVVEAEGIS